ncbi:MAG: adenylyl-sulfate kinase [Alphaproteobacteria bacterium]|nr:adenylyl-sulfate kinase [Alphaproteobacteria bacterium]
MVIWITGLSGAGKTTLCQALKALLNPVMPGLVLLDGDDVRAALGPDLGYAEAYRVVQIQRIQRLAKLLADQGLVVLVGALYASPELLAWNREHLRGYFEVYLEADLALVRSRDAKGLYAAAAAGKMADVVGMDIPWVPPAHPDLTLDAGQAEPADALARRIVDAIPDLRSRLRAVA